MVEWREDRPKWQQIAEVIRQRIADGTYPPGSRVPSEHELVQTYGVARVTARKALIRLRDEGLVYAVHGMGTFVAPRDEDDTPGR